MDIIEELRKIPVANIGDACNRMACMLGDIKSMNHQMACGRAYTVDVPAGDNLLFYYAIERAHKGDIIVVDGKGDCHRALCGEIMASLGKAKGLGGFIVNGAIRDLDEIKEMDFPVFALDVSPNGPYKNGPGKIKCDVVIDGKVVHYGDYILANHEGIVVISPDEVEDVIERGHAIMAKEAKMKQSIMDTGDMDLEWMFKKVKELGLVNEDE